MRQVVVWIGWVSFVLGMIGCGERTTNSAEILQGCVPGTAQECPCEGVYQECKEDGSGFTSCDCVGLAGSESSNEGGENPEEGGVKPEEGGENPDEGGENPDEGGENPDEGGENPDEGGEKPDEGGENPDEGGEKPDEGGETSECVPTEPADEICDGVDNDCDGNVDNGVLCDDGNPCTDDSCVDGACSAEPNESPCEDGEVCTEGDFCTEGECVSGEVVCQVCESNSDCEEGLLCDNFICSEPCLPGYGKCEDGILKSCSYNLVHDQEISCFFTGACDTVEDYYGISAGYCVWSHVEGDLNETTVTVKVGIPTTSDDGFFSGRVPAEGAFVVVGSDGEFPHQGLTDGDGMIVFDGLEAGVPRDVSVVLDGFVASSIQQGKGSLFHFSLNPIPQVEEPSDEEEEGPIFTVTGTVPDLASMQQELSPLLCAGEACLTCKEELDCPEGSACIDTLDGGFCLEACASSFNCDSGYACGMYGEQGSHCRPLGFVADSYCYWTSQRNRQNPAAVRASADGTFEMERSDFGPFAIICIAGRRIGGYPDAGGTFDPADLEDIRLGAVRVVAVPGGVEEVEVPLDNEMDGRVYGRLASEMDLSDLSALLPDFAYMTSGLSLGIYGYWSSIGGASSYDGTALLRLGNIPSVVQGSLDSARFYGFGGIYSLTDDNQPLSRAMEDHKEGMATTRIVNDDGEQDFLEGKPLNRLSRADSSSAVWAVGEQGVAGAQVDGEWQWNPHPDKPDFVAVHGFSESSALMASTTSLYGLENGTWTAFPSLDVPDVGEIRDIWAASPTEVYVLFPLSLYRFDGETYESMSLPFGSGWRALDGGDGRVVAVGLGSSAGVYTIGDEGGFTELPLGSSPVSWNDVHVLNASEIILVGAGGNVLRYNGVSVEDESISASGDCLSVTSTPNGELRILESGNTIHQFVEEEWTSFAVNVPESHLTELAYGPSGGMHLGYKQVEFGMLPDFWEFAEAGSGDLLNLSGDAPLTFNPLGFSDTFRKLLLGETTGEGAPLYVWDIRTAGETGGLNLPNLHCLTDQFPLEETDNGIATTVVYGYNAPGTITEPLEPFFERHTPMASIVGVPDLQFEFGVCCSVDADCDDGKSCTINSCTGATCSTSWDEETCPCEAGEVWVESFEFGQTENLLFDNSSDGVGWQILEGGNAFDGTGSLYYGNPELLNYASDTGAAHFGVARFEGVSLPFAQTTTLRFQVWLDTETAAAFDTLSVVADLPGQEPVVLWEKGPETPQEQWHLVEVDLSVYAESTLALEWVFDTVDGTANLGEGVYVDGITIESTCDP